MTSRFFAILGLAPAGDIPNHCRNGDSVTLLRSPLDIRTTKSVSKQGNISVNDIYH